MKIECTEIKIECTKFVTDNLEIESIFENEFSRFDYEKMQYNIDLCEGIAEFKITFMDLEIETPRFTVWKIDKNRWVRASNIDKFATKVYGPSFTFEALYSIDEFIRDNNRKYDVIDGRCLTGSGLKYLECVKFEENTSDKIKKGDAYFKIQSEGLEISIGKFTLYDENGLMWLLNGDGSFSVSGPRFTVEALEAIDKFVEDKKNKEITIKENIND